MVYFQGIQERIESGVGCSKETRFDAVSRRAHDPHSVSTFRGRIDF